jgi:hypothetical protein
LSRPSFRSTLARLGAVVVVPNGARVAGLQRRCTARWRVRLGAAEVFPGRRADILIATGQGIIGHIIATDARLICHVGISVLDAILARPPEHYSGRLRAALGVGSQEDGNYW